jgi:hypothetical protein
MSVHITTHAVERYRERIDPNGDAADILSALQEAKPALLRALERGRRNTLIIKTERCFLICSANRVISVVKEMRGATS